MPRIKIEDKHTYASANYSVHGRMGNGVDVNVFDPGMIEGNIPVFPAPGTDENNRIGRKITTSTLMWETFLVLNNAISNNTANTKTIGQWYREYAANLSTTATTSNNLFFPAEYGDMLKVAPMNVSIREFVVEFDLEFFSDFVNGDVLDTANPEFKILLNSWFNNLNIQNGNNVHSSNRTIVKRESTGYTGQFNILYDRVHYMSFSKPVIHIKESIPYKRTLNFNSGTAAILPSNKLVLHIFVGPYSIYIDYGNLTFGDYLSDRVLSNQDNKLVVCQVFDTLKLKYVDL